LQKQTRQLTIKIENHFHFLKVPMANKNRIHNRNYIMRIAQEFSTPFTAKDIANKIEQDGNHLGVTTIYRTLNEFVDSGLLRKSLGENNTATFIHLKECPNDDHVYLECLGCHKIFHIDCHHFSGLRRHISRQHHFDITNFQATIPGYCTECEKHHEK